MSALGIVRAKQDDVAQASQLLFKSFELHVDTMGTSHMKTLACHYQLPLDPESGRAVDEPHSSNPKRARGLGYPSLEEQATA